jgi:hypothetical protein
VGKERLERLNGSGFVDNSGKQGVFHGRLAKNIGPLS